MPLTRGPYPKVSSRHFQVRPERSYVYESHSKFNGPTGISTGASGVHIRILLLCLIRKWIREAGGFTSAVSEAPYSKESAGHSPVTGMYQRQVPRQRIEQANGEARRELSQALPKEASDWLRDAQVVALATMQTFRQPIRYDTIGERGYLTMSRHKGNR